MPETVDEFSIDYKCIDGRLMTVMVTKERKRGDISREVGNLNLNPTQ